MILIVILCNTKLYVNKESNMFVKKNIRWKVLFKNDGNRVYRPFTQKLIRQENQVAEESTVKSVQVAYIGIQEDDIVFLKVFSE